jgi:chorismate mutase
MSVLNFPKQSAAVQQLSDALRELVYSFASRISVAEAIGALEIAKHEVIEDQK